MPTLTAMVVGSIIGSGVVLLPRRFGVIALGAVAGVVSLATGAIEI